jgi:YVTN family beta-propeller protein
MRVRAIRAGRQVVAGALLIVLSLTGTGLAASATVAKTAPPVFVYVTNEGNKVIVISGAANKVTKTIKVDSRPNAIAITPNDRTVYVAVDRHAVVPINAVTNRYERAPIQVAGGQPVAIAITPDSKMAYVVSRNQPTGTVTPIVTATNQALSPITVGSNPVSIAITPDGKMAYVANSVSGTITPIVIATNQALSPISVGANPGSIAFTPNSAMGYVTIADGKVVPFSTATNEAGPQLPVGSGSSGIAFSADSKLAFMRLRNSESHRLVFISTATGNVVKTVTFGPSISDISAIATSPNAKTVYVAEYDAFEKAAVFPISIATGKVGKPIKMAAIVDSIKFIPNGRAAWALMAQSQVGSFSTATGKVGEPIPAGSQTGSMVITP